MKLSEWIKEYRTSHGLSMQNMADLCGFSKAYIGVLEKGINPKTQKPISPSIQTFQKISEAVGIDIDEFIKMLDSDQLITISSPEVASTPSPHDQAMIEAYHNAYEDIRDIVDNALNRFSKKDLKVLAAKEKKTSTAM